MDSQQEGDYIETESTGEIENDQNDGNDLWPNEISESDLNNARREVLSGLTDGNYLEPFVLGSSFRVPDIPKKFIEPIALDTSLPHIPIYTHLKTYDLKPIERPPTPPILSELRVKCHFREGLESYRSSKTSPSTGRTSKRRSSIISKSRESARNLKTE